MANVFAIHVIFAPLQAHKRRATSILLFASMHRGEEIASSSVIVEERDTVRAEATRRRRRRRHCARNDSPTSLLVYYEEEDDDAARFVVRLDAFPPCILSVQRLTIARALQRL